MFCPYFQVDSMYFPALEVNRYCFPMIMIYIVKIHIRDNEKMQNHFIQSDPASYVFQSDPASYVYS